MSYPDWFGRDGHRNNPHKDFTFYVHVQDPATLRPEEVARRDSAAARDIEEARQLIADLMQYRQALAAR